MSSSYPLLPSGVRDHLPAASMRLRHVQAALRDEFARWGYEGIITPLYEYVAVLERGLGRGRRRETFKFVEPRTGEVVALRPDITPQVARLYATRYAKLAAPARFSYEGRVVRFASDAGSAGSSGEEWNGWNTGFGRSGAGQAGPNEVFQAGVELLGCGGPEADAEVISLLHASLRAAGLSSLQIDLGQGEVGKAILEGLSLSPALRAQAAALISRKDASGLAVLCEEQELAPADTRALIGLCSWYGPVSVLDLAEAALTSPAALAALAQLREVVALLQAEGLGDSISVDLGELRDLDYHDGILFHAYVPGLGVAVAGGGRYDHLCERYGRRARATGFAIDLEAVLLALDGAGTSSPQPPPRFLVAGERALAGEVVHALRATGAVVVRALDAAEVLGARDAAFDLIAQVQADAVTLARPAQPEAGARVTSLPLLLGAASEDSEAVLRLWSTLAVVP